MADLQATIEKEFASFPETKTAEDSAISTCETDTKQNEIEKATKEQDVKCKTIEAVRQRSSWTKRSESLALLTAASSSTWSRD